ncbi:Aste57867_9561 [Aphanomyces stellatus]|uniref:Aste57867_9561 protein n=1 Tax=Aphanomyces stellatus TaxID=120398 RepID=A0A485KN64_9STRA|nr:hypothetical protein As57867_009523 [Aphanomyces stellatus]VFT86440.1 Aste57867_9561 [Aphanomyces stellatus]
MAKYVVGRDVNAHSRTLSEHLKDAKEDRVYATEIGIFDAAYLFIDLEGIASYRGVSEDGIEKHMLGFKEYGYDPSERLLICTPGPSGFNFGVMDEQHRCMALKRLFDECQRNDDGTLNLGGEVNPYRRALSPLLVDGRRLMVPCIIKENLSAQEYIELANMYNNMPHQGSADSAYAWKELCKKYFDWTKYDETNRFRKIVETGSKKAGKLSKGSTDSLTNQCLEHVRKLHVSEHFLTLGKTTAENLVQATVRLHHLGVFDYLPSTIRDPGMKKDKMLVNHWKQFSTFINNFYWYFSRGVTWNGTRWSAQDVSKSLNLLTQAFLLHQYGSGS